MVSLSGRTDGGPRFALGCAGIEPGADFFHSPNHAAPDGIIHIVAGGGGATLYGPGLEKTAVTLKKEHGDNYTEYTAKMVADRHSFVVLDASIDSLKLRALDLNGKTFDQINLTKPQK
jgi:acid phosphatase type 7